MSVNWFGSQVDAAIKAKCGANVMPAAERYQHHLLDLIDTLGPPRSTPGNPPHVDTGDLFQSISIDVSAAQLAGRILSTDIASYLMELGTMNVEPRPAWVPALWDNADDIAREMCQP